jgi:bifunctional non-homologous end joining protein LigD
MARLLSSRIPTDADDVVVRADDQDVHLTNLGKPYWPERGYTKGDLLRYYERMSPVLLPHVRDRPMVMKRYPHGWSGKFFFMKRTPAYKPAWLRTCRVEHRSGNVIDFPVIDDVAGLLWVINLGCIDLNPWYSRCDDVHRPDFLHFDLDPVPGASFATVRAVALRVRDLLGGLGMPVFAKTTGSKGMHLYVPLVRGPTQKQVWTFAKAFAIEVERRHPELATAVYEVAARPRGRVLVDYNQNRWGSTLASVYSVRPKLEASVSTPVTWEEVERGIEIADFTLANVPARVEELGDLWCPPTGGVRYELAPLLGAAAKFLPAGDLARE